MKYTLLLFLLIGGLQLNAQDELWQTQISTAKDLAAENDHRILMVFSGSDWCKPCMQMKQKIWESPEFSNYAKENLVLLELDFPAKKKNKLSPEQTAHNESLAEQYETRIFPTAILLDAAGNEIDRFGYQSSMNATDYISYIQSKLAP